VGKVNLPGGPNGEHTKKKKGDIKECPKQGSRTKKRSITNQNILGLSNLGKNLLVQKREKNPIEKLSPKKKEERK